MFVRVLRFPSAALLPEADGKEKVNGITHLCVSRGTGQGKARRGRRSGDQRSFQEKTTILGHGGRLRGSKRAGGCLHPPSSQGPPGAPECSPEAENGNDNDHQDQHHTHDGRACDQGQLLPPVLVLWGRKAVIRRSRRAPGTPHQPQGTSCVPLRTGPPRWGRCGKAPRFPNCFPPVRAPA